MNAEDVMRRRLDRANERVRVLEAMIEDHSRELYLAGQKARESATFLHDVLMAVPGLVVVFDQAGRIDTVNETGATMLGFLPEDLVGRPVATLFADGEAPVFDAVARAAAGPGGAPRMERTCVARDGTPIPVLLSVGVIESEASDETARRVVAVAVDIRDQKKYEIELRQSQKLEAVGRLAAGVAHEINTPVQFVNDSIHFLRDAAGDLGRLVAAYRRFIAAVTAGEDPAALVGAVRELEEEVDLSYLLEQSPKAFERSVDGLDRVATIVRSMKTFAHPDVRDMTSVQLNNAIDSVLTIARNEYKYVADVETDFKAIPLVRCYAGDVNQVLLNVIINAAHAIGEVVAQGKPRGRITVRTWQEGDEVVVAIADTGGGIPDSVRDRVFDPFFTTKPVGQGTGQGLSLARSVIVDRHGGSIWFKTAPGEGTTFFIHLPIDGAPARVAA